MSEREHLQHIREINDRFRYLKSIESLFELDQWSALPAGGGAYRQQTAAYVARQKAALFFSDDARAAAEYFRGADTLGMDDVIERALVRTFLFRYRNATRTPEELTRQYSLLRAEAMNKWKEARQARDFQIFAPVLERVFTLKKQIALAIGPDAPAFDTLIALTDEGADRREIDRAFEALGAGTRELLARIRGSAVKPDRSLLGAEQDPDKMAAFARRLARESGYDESRGGFNDRVVHAFTSFLGPRDARISTYRSGSVNLIFTCLHEAGHAMYASGGSDAVNAANLWGGAEGGFHEAMARFNENMLGRSRAYWEHYYPQLQAEFPDFRDVPAEDFYRAVNAVEPGARRITADEVSYSLHVILRYELERAWFSGELKTADLARAWNERSERYLGVHPADDAEGILQDMHWAGDYIGYFQSYALGNLYGAQIHEAVRAAVPTLDAELARGDFAALNAWLDENVRQYGCCYTAPELAERISGKRLDAVPFLRYLEGKYAALYRV